MEETWSAVADALALAAAISSADGISGAAGTETCGANGVVTAPAGAASVPMSTAAAHSTAALRPDPVKTICRNLEVIRLGGPDHGRAVPLVCSPAVPRLRELLHFSNSSHINNIKHNSVIFGLAKRACRNSGTRPPVIDRRLSNTARRAGAPRVRSVWMVPAGTCSGRYRSGSPDRSPACPAAGPLRGRSARRPPPPRALRKQARRK